MSPYDEPEQCRATAPDQTNKKRSKQSIPAKLFQEGMVIRIVESRKTVNRQPILKPKFMRSPTSRAERNRST
ncbi:MAG TPA: hypothetical protein DDX19_25935 [Rhodopirellula baltica]|nr:hypothetical protein [Rhodopirellula baltica]